MDVSLGYGFTGAFSNSSETISKLIECGNKTGDPIWYEQFFIAFIF